MPAGLVPQLTTGSRVQTPAGPGEIVAVAAVAYYSERSDNKRAVVLWQHRGQEYPGPFIVQLDAGGPWQGFTWPQLVGVPA